MKQARKTIAAGTLSCAKLTGHIHCPIITTLEPGRVLTDRASGTGSAGCPTNPLATPKCCDICCQIFNKRSIIHVPPTNFSVSPELLNSIHLNSFLQDSSSCTSAVTEPSLPRADVRAARAG